MQYLRFLFDQDISKYPLLNTGVYRRVNGFLPAHSLFYILFYFRRKLRILPQPVALLHKCPVVAAVNVQYFTGTFQTAAPPSSRKGIRQIEQQIVSLHTGTVIKNNVYGRRQFYALRTVNVIFSGGKKPFKLLGKV